jgi:hypothetical protein
MDLPDLAYQRMSVTSIGAPTSFAVNPIYPNLEIHFNIKPISSGQLAIIYNTDVQTVVANDTMQIPAEFGDLLTCALARRLSVLKQMPGDIQASCDVLYKSALNRVKVSHARFQIPTLEGLMRATNLAVAKHNVLVG